MAPTPLAQSMVLCLICDQLRYLADEMKQLVKFVQNYERIDQGSVIFFLCYTLAKQTGQIDKYHSIVVEGWW